MREISRRQFVHRGVVAGGAAAAALSPWATKLASAAGAAVPALDARRRATCVALAEVVADYPGADTDVKGAVSSLATRYEGCRARDRTSMDHVLDAVEACTPSGGFSAASKQERAAALRGSVDELHAGKLRPGSKALLVDAGLASVAAHLVYDYRSFSPKPIPTY